MIDSIYLLISMLIYCLKITLLEPEKIDTKSIIKGDKKDIIFKLENSTKWMARAMRCISNLKDDLKQQKYIINDLKAELEAEKIKNSKLEAELEFQKFQITILKSKLVKQNETITDLKSKFDYLDFKNLKSNTIYSKCFICVKNITTIYCDPCGHTYCDKCIKTSYNCKDCKSVMRLCSDK